MDKRTDGKATRGRSVGLRCGRSVGLRFSYNNWKTLLVFYLLFFYLPPDFNFSLTCVHFFLYILCFNVLIGNRKIKIIYLPQ